ncbi:polysaccharide lyase family protein [Xylanibacter muris]|uniref:rhamnogalacturonan endolyase n=1 Tax=Xylanibacter muris TaxID=2736290 RepID=A0ABX2AIV2_9BACT|nr:polysaccharide lyase family protein [Xylanibacter muris]NPD90994.1 hypothetical protein [Xylanibacter muris]
MKKLLLTAITALAALGAGAQDNVTMSMKDRTTTMDNGLVRITIGSNGRISNMTRAGSSNNLLGSNGIYFDYTAASNQGLNPSKAEIIKQTDDYAEVLYSNTSDNLRFQQGFIMRKGVSGVYVYVIANGTSGSESVNLREARVCTRLNSGFLNGYVDDRMNGKIPSNSQMAVAEREENTISDATYRMEDGSVYTKYNWAQYVVNDSVHGLMNNNTGVWNIACSHEWINGGPMKQELTVHATSKSPISIMMIQGEHMGASAQIYKDGERKIYGPFFIYVNSATEPGTPDRKAVMIADAKAQASKQMAEWPFEWFENDLYPLDRATVSGHLNVTTGQGNDEIQMVLAEPGVDPYLQGKKYIYWAKTDADGNFSIKNVRKGEYTLYAYATKGDITDELQKNNIIVDAEEVNLGNVDWTPAMYEYKLWQIGENNRMSDGFHFSDTLRNYGLWDLPPANLTYTVGQSVPEKDWYYAQTQNGTWTVKFDLDRTYTGLAYLTMSIAGSANKPKLAVAVNGAKQKEYSMYNDAAIYRSAVLGGRHSLNILKFPASLLKKGTNTVSFTMSGIKNNGGVMYDCIKLEAGNAVTSGITQVETSDNVPVTLYTVGGVKIGTFNSMSDVNVRPGMYIFRQGNKSGKAVF